MATQSAFRLRMTPQEIFVGDSVQLECVFSTDNPALSAAAEKPSPERLKSYDTAACTVIDARLSVSGSECTVLVTFIPWKTGSVSVPRIDFGTETAPFYVDIPPVQVVSLLETAVNRELRPPAAPLVIPGTTYLLYGTLVALVVLCALVCVLFVKSRSIRKWFALSALRRKYRRNYSALLKTLRSLEKKGLALTGGEFTTRIARSARIYLDGRYGPVFSVSTTAELLPLARESGLPETAIELFQSVFSRCDAVRFAAVSGSGEVPADSERKALLRFVRDAARECEHAEL